MTSRRNFLQKGSLGFLSSLLLPFPANSENTPDFIGSVVNKEDGEAYRMRDGTAIVRIKISKVQGAPISILSESYRPGDFGPVHKHLNEDELLFFHKGTGTFTLADKEYPVKEGSVVLVPKGVWHGWKNTGTENIEVYFSYAPSDFEGFFREVGVPLDQPFVQKTMEQRRAIAKKWGMIYRD
jgi:mannose-6-phosphate isomerase-like protein (cupin superfamily)